MIANSVDCQIRQKFVLVVDQHQSFGESKKIIDRQSVKGEHWWYSISQGSLSCHSAYVVVQGTCTSAIHEFLSDITSDRFYENNGEIYTYKLLLKKLDSLLALWLPREVRGVLDGLVLLLGLFLLSLQENPKRYNKQMSKHYQIGCTQIQEIQLINQKLIIYLKLLRYMQFYHLGENEKLKYWTFNSLKEIGRVSVTQTAWHSLILLHLS